MADNGTKNPILLRDNLLVRWQHQGEEYMLHVHKDPDARSPRITRSYDDVLAVFDGRYGPGDPEWEGLSQEDFWNDYADRLVTDESAEAIALANGIQVRDVPGNEGMPLLDRAIRHAAMGDNRSLMGLTNKLAACVPVYSHAVPRLSPYPSVRTETSERPIGWCWVSKDDVLSWDGANEANWWQTAMRYMEKSVKDYGDYVQGNNWWCQLLAMRDGEWTDYRTHCGFTGTCLEKSRIPEEIRFGLPKAIESGTYRLGTAKQVASWRYDMEGNGTDGNAKE